MYICTHMYMQTCICVNTRVYNKGKYRYSQTGDVASIMEGRKMCRKLFFFSRGGKGSEGVDGMIYYYTSQD